MTTTTTSARPRGAKRISLGWIAPVILLTAALLLIINVTTSMPTRDTVSILNRSAAEVTVEVSDSSGTSWLPIGTADPNARERVESVIDQGGVWRFRFMVGPDNVGEIRRSADQLRAAGWTVTIPADAADTLREARRS